MWPFRTMAMIWRWLLTSLQWKNCMLSLQFLICLAVTIRLVCRDFRFKCFELTTITWKQTRCIFATNHAHRSPLYDLFIKVSEFFLRQVDVPSSAGVLEIYNITYRPVSFHFRRPSEHRILNYRYTPLVLPHLKLQREAAGNPKNLHSHA